VAAVVHDEDLPLQVNDVVVVERSVCVKDECLDLSRVVVIPELALVDGTSTIEEDEAAHVGVRLELA